MENRQQRRKEKKKQQHLMWEKFKNLWRVETTDDNIVSASPPVSVKQIFRKFWPYARSYRFWIILSLLFIALHPLVQSATIWLLQVFIDRVLVEGNFTPLYWLLLTYLGLTILGGILSFSGTYLSNWVGQNFILSLRKSLL